MFWIYIDDIPHGRVGPELFHFPVKGYCSWHEMMIQFGWGGVSRNRGKVRVYIILGGVSI